MARYDYLRNGEASSVTPFGKKIVKYQNRYFTRLIRNFSASQEIDLLEIGPGQGFFAEACAEHQIQYTGIEANALMAEDLRKRGFQVYSYTVPPIPIEKTYDVIFMNQVFEHVRGSAEAFALLASCQNHLREQGLLIISCPDFLRWKEDFYHDYTHDYPTTVTRFSQMFFDNGLKIIYRNWYSFFARGFFLTGCVAFLSRIGYRTGLFKLLFAEKAYKVHCSLLPSFIILGLKREEHRE